LRDEAYAVVGKPEPLDLGDEIVGVVTAPDGKVLDVIRSVK
jgi:citrate lyase subunit alpha/citrate CoA-transferase